MTTTVDARGLSCPQPVILSRNAVQGAKFPIEVLVDSVTSRENVRRMAERSGLKVQVERVGDEFKLIISR
jgi:TusA-related sulfurtransferase